MATTAPPANSADARTADNPFCIPPEETIWKRYSPHHEAPLSFVGSAATHLLVLGLIGAGVALAYWAFKSQAQPLPIDMVRMGGGGGSPTGHRDAPRTRLGGADV